MMRTVPVERGGREVAPGPPTCYRKCNFNEKDLIWDHQGENLGGDAAAGEHPEEEVE